MKYLDGFRNSAAARALAARIADRAARLDRPIRIMEVCGSHTMAIGRFGLRGMLPPTVELVSGPGCPVCVTDAGYLDAALDLAGRGARLATFGDLLRVPGSRGTLAQARAEGAHVDVCYSPDQALDFARAHPGEEIVFLGIGFETTIPPVVSLVELARHGGINNLSLLTAFKLIPPALEALAADADLAIDAFLCPAHVSAIIGARAYEPFAQRHRRPCVVAGFEPLDILLGVDGLLAQLAAGEARVENQYNRVVRPNGNPKARALMETYLEPCAADWRGLGRVPDSALRLRAEWRAYDAAARFGLELAPGRVPPGCRCGDVIRGRLTPPACPLFDGACAPDHPVGPCMVSAEGSCAAWHKYERLRAAEAAP